jgi:hypothetical protein
MPRANGSDMVSACSDIGGPVDQNLASACLAFEYVPQGKYEPGVKFMPVQASSTRSGGAVVGIRDCHRKGIFKLATTVRVRSRHAPRMSA